MIIRRVWKAKKKNQLLITIPKNKGIKEGDYIKIEKVRSEGRIGFQPYTESLPVYTFWDLGIGHPTAILFVQFVKREIRIINILINDHSSLLSLEDEDG